MSSNLRHRAERVIVTLARFLPGWRRASWQDEWLGEIGSASQPSLTQLIGWTAGASAHVLWLWGREWSVNMIGSDIRFACRTLLRQRAFSLTALITLALGIGATTAMFTIVNALLLRPLPYPEADRIVTVWPGTSFSPGGLGAALNHSDAFAAIGAYSGWGMTVSGSRQAESLRGARVTPSLFQVLGVSPRAGRLFLPDEDRSGREGVALISEGYASRRFGSTDAALGQRLIVNGVSCEVVGVMPASFAFPDSRSDVWTPITIDPGRPDYNAGFASLLGRLAPGVTAAAAQDQMRVFAEDLRKKNPKQYGDKFIQRAVVIPLQSRLVRTIRTPLLLLFGAVSILLLIACANVAVLMLTRATARQGEIAVRAAMGAERLRIVRQLLVESLLLASIGGVGGILLAVWLVGLATPFIPVDLPHTARPAIEVTVLGFAMLTVVGSALFFGLVPAWQLSRADMRQVLSASRGAETAQHGRSLRAFLVFAEVALATVLVVSAALLGRSFAELSRVQIGLDPSHVLTIRASAPSDRYKEPGQVTAVFDAMSERLSGMSGVERVGAIQLLPLTLDNWNPGVVVEGLAEAEQYPADINWRVVTPAYFETMSIPLRRGRSIAAGDTSGTTPVALVNETFARVVFGKNDPIGRRIHTGFEAKGEWVEIVGVVADVHQHTIEDPASPEMYRPFAQHPINSMRLMLRTAGDPASVATAARAAIAAVDPNIAIADVEPMSSVVDRLFGDRRAPLIVAGFLAVAALVLGLVGVTGVLAFDVSQRRREIGIRLALGATRVQVSRMVFQRGLVLAVAGVAAGVGGALVSARALKSMLFGVSPTDPLTISVVAFTFIAVMTIAMYSPARKAASVNPLETMKD